MWSVITQIVVSFMSGILLATGTLFFTYFQVKKNNFHNKKQEIIVGYLIESYRKLALAVQRNPEKNSPYFRDLESVVADIQLFGTKSQNKALINLLDEWSLKNMGSLDDLLTQLRNHIRSELALEKVDEPVRWFRPEGAPKPESGNFGI